MLTPMLRASAPRTSPRLRPRIDAKTRLRLCVDQPAAIPLSTEEMDSVFALPYKRVPHPAYGNARILGLGNDPFGQHYARLLWRLFFCSITEDEGALFRAVRKIRSLMRSSDPLTLFQVFRA
ncbi:hypothetical protein ACVXG9_18310 [Escherichia coli]